MRAGCYAEAVAGYARLLMQAPELAETLAIADNLALARQRYRRERAATNATPRVAVCGWSLGHNPAGRVDTLARLYQSMAEVEIIGCLFPSWGRTIWAPIRNTPIPIHSLLVEDESRFIEQALELVLAHPYDVLHLSKPRLPNILIGLLYKWLWEASVLVDIDDEELAFVGADAPLRLDQCLLQPLGSLIDKTSTRLAVGLANSFDGVTVANAALQQRYSGAIIRHARDEQQFQPSSERRQRAREPLGIAPEQRVVLFLGSPRQHKGLLETGQALASLARTDTLLLVIGSFPPDLLSLREALRAIPGLNVRFLDDQPFERIPDLLASGDIAVLMQDPASLAARFQTPAKLSDALAMGLTVLAEPTPGLAEFVECGAVTAVSREHLAPALRQAIEATGAKRRQAPVAHPAFVTRLSYAANRPVVQSLLESRGRDHGRLRRLPSELARLGVAPWFGPLWRALSQVWPEDRAGVSIIILTLNGAALLDRLLRSFVAMNTHRPVELIVVDHGALDDPGDQTAAVIERYRAVCELWYVRRGANHSFSASCNFGAEWARYPNLLFLNNDIIYSADALPAALAKLAEPDIGCVGIRLDDDPDSLPTGQEPGIQHLGIHFPWSESRGYHHPRQIRHGSLKTYLEQDARIQGVRQPAVTGAFLLCRQRDFRRLGGFSTEYDYGLEDIDFCLRLTRDLGRSAWCLTSLGLQHAESSTRKRDQTLTSERIERNHRYFKRLWSAHTSAFAASARKTPGSILNVLFVLPQAIDTNSGYHVQLHASRLQTQGADCIVAVPDRHHVEASGSLCTRSYRQILSGALDIGFQDGRGPDLVHAWTPREIVRRFVEGVRGRWRCPLVVHLEDNEEHLTEVAVGRPFAELARLSLAELDRCIPEHRYHPQRGRWFLDRADGLTLVIETLERFNRYRRPSLVLSAPVDERLFYPRPLNRALRQALAIGDDQGVLAYTGNVHAANRREVGELYRAVASLNQQGRPTILLRTGWNGDHGAVDAVAQVRELGWVEREQVPEILAAADVLVQPGEPGAFNDQRIPSKLPEYFAMGRPVVLARSHLGLDVCPGEEALVVGAANASEIVQAVRTIREDQALAERLALGARRFYERRLRVADGALFEFMRVFNTTLSDFRPTH
ncbi:hypothetical protein CKO29_08075 [Allochromatium vinosum]|nr:hypothetical protein [Allochromatium vinosum]